jgi:L-fuconolactonase
MHVWRADRAAYPWLADVPSISRTFDVGDVADEQAVVGVTDVVLVQAADNVDDTENMLRAAQRYAQVAGVVAWVPLREPDGTEALLDRWRHERIVGVRHLVHRDPDPNFLRDPAVNEVLDLLSGRGLAFDVCAETTHLLGLIPGLAERHPQLTLVVDHLGKPPIRERGWEPWASRLADAAEAPNVVAKLSGLNTAAAPGATRDDYAPYVEHALDVFGPDRVMYGGDWPFALLAAASYQQIWEPLRGCLDALDVGARHAVLAGTARRTYRLAR